MRWSLKIIALLLLTCTSCKSAEPAAGIKEEERPLESVDFQKMKARCKVDPTCVWPDDATNP